jgi:hypothetical protein
LKKEDRARGIQLDHKGDQQEQGKEREQPKRGKAKIHEPLRAIVEIAVLALN